MEVEHTPSPYALTYVSILESMLLLQVHPQTTFYDWQNSSYDR